MNAEAVVRFGLEVLGAIFAGLLVVSGWSTAKDALTTILRRKAMLIQERDFYRAEVDQLRARNAELEQAFAEVRKFLPVPYRSPARPEGEG